MRLASMAKKQKSEAAGKILLFLSGTIIGAILVFAFFSLAKAEDCKPQALFSPNSDAEIFSLINSAQESIDLEMYVFTYQPLADALINASKRGVKVRVILESRLDNSGTQQTIFSYLKGNGVEVKWASAVFTRTHSKLLVVDGKKALVGSINFSRSAVKTNREAAAIVCGETVAEYTRVFENDWKEAA